MECVQVVIFDVQTQRLCIGSRDDVVAVQFIRGEAARRQTDIPIIDDKVASDCHADSVFFLFLWADIRHKSRIRGPLIVGKIFFGDEGDGVCTGNVSYALCQPAKFACSCL